MVQTSVVVNGNELVVTYKESSEVYVSGILTASVFLKDECTDLLYFVSPSEPKTSTISFIGSDLTVVFKSPTAVVIRGNVDELRMINSKGEVVKTYKINQCDSDFPFTPVGS